MLIAGEARRLYLCRGGRLWRRYPIGHGRRGWDKRREGDRKTPLGTYRIAWMAARHEPRRRAAQERRLRRYQIRRRAAWCAPDRQARHGRFRRDRGPRGERLWTRPYGGKKASVMCLNYPNAHDRGQGKTGSCIEIHSSFQLRRGSAGCVLLYPRQAREVYNCVRPGTRVELRLKP